MRLSVACPNKRLVIFAATKKGDKKMIVECYEVYEYNSPRTVAFLTKELAESQEVFASVDFIEKVTLDLCDKEVKELNEGKPVFD